MRLELFETIEKSSIEKKIRRTKSNHNYPKILSHSIQMINMIDMIDIIDMIESYGPHQITT